MNAKRLTAVAFLLAVVGALVAALAPTGSVMMEDAGSPGGVVVRRSSNVSMFQTDGAWVLVVVSVPVLVALVPVLVRHRAARVASAVLLWIGCIVGMWSVGTFFVPGAVVMTVAAARHEPTVVRPMPPVPAG